MAVPNARYVSPPNPLAYCGNLYIKQLGYVFVCEVGVAHLSKYFFIAARMNLDLSPSILAPALMRVNISLSTANPINSLFGLAVFAGTPR